MRFTVQQPDPPILDYAAERSAPVSPRRSLLKCLPGVLALPTFLVAQSGYAPAGYLFYILLILGVAIAVFWLIRFRRRHHTSPRQWFIWLTLAVHTLVLLSGVVIAAIWAFAVLAGPW